MSFPLVSLSRRSPKDEAKRDSKYKADMASSRVSAVEHPYADDSEERRNEPENENDASSAARSESHTKTTQPSSPALFSVRWGDPVLAQPKRLFWKAMILGTAITVIDVLGVLSIYWGAFWRAPAHAHNLRVAVIDLDQGPIGQAIIDTFTSRSVTGAPEQLTYEISRNGAFADEEQIVRYVTAEKAWAAIVVAQGASDRLGRAVQSADPSYNSSLAVSVIFERARNENAIPTYVLTQTQNALNAFADRFAQDHARNLSANGDLSRLLTTAPSLMTRPVGYHLRDLHPFDVPVASAVDFVGLIYLLIASFLVAVNNFNARQELGPVDRRLLAFPTLLKLRFFSALGNYFLISWTYCFISLFFQVPFSRFHGRGGFVIYWAISYLGMCALGLVLETMLTLLTMRFNPFFMIIWIIVNVSVSFYPIELLPGVFRYGYAMPFYHVGRAVRTIVFGTKNTLGLNFGVLIAWVCVAMASLSAALWITRRIDVAQHRRTLASRGGP